MTELDVNPLPAELAQGQLLVLGGGYTGQHLAAQVRRLGGSVRVSRRQPEPGSNDLAFDSGNGVVPTAAALGGTTHLLVTIPPSPGGQDPVLQCLGAQLQQLPLRWVGYLSSTGVYGDRQGGWVTETSAVGPPLQRRSAARLACEQAWQASGLPVQIFRLPGIYGPGRNPLLGLRRGEARLIHKAGQVFCRIHRDDIVGALLHCLGLPPSQRPPLLNLVDQQPAPSSELLGFAAHLLQCPLPPYQNFEAVAPQLSPMALSFWQDNRRVSNQLLTEGLGYRLLYPSYREGLRACLSEEEQLPGWGGQG